MSDISALSHQYEKLVATSDKINNAVIAFKKQSILANVASKEKYPRLQVTDDELKVAKEMLMPFLENVLKITDEDSLQSEFIPLPILQNYKEKLSERAFLKEELTRVMEYLKNNNSIGTDDMEVLDTILSVLDNERSTLFRKLRKARG